MCFRLFSGNATKCSLSPYTAKMMLLFFSFPTLCKIHTRRDRSVLVIGDDNQILLTITAVNKGEGAYETELHTLLPPEADYIGVKRSAEVQKKCAHTHTSMCTKAYTMHTRVLTQLMVRLSSMRTEKRCAHSKRKRAM